MYSDPTAVGTINARSNSVTKYEARPEGAIKSEMITNTNTTALITNIAYQIFVQLHNFFQ